MALQPLSSEFHDDFFIGGQWVKALTPNRTPIVNPATEVVWGHVPDAGQPDIDRAVGLHARPLSRASGARQVLPNAPKSCCASPMNSPLAVS